jgi:hypothetical protein
VTRHHSCRVSPFGHPRINARLTAPRGITQPPTSFIGSQCQGIHHAPLNTYNTKPKAIFQTLKLHINTHSQECVLDARNHYPQIKHHTPPPKTGQQHEGVVSKPNSVSVISRQPPIPWAGTFVVHPARATTATGSITASSCPVQKLFRGAP